MSSIRRHSRRQRDGAVPRGVLDCYDRFYFYRHESGVFAHVEAHRGHGRGKKVAQFHEGNDGRLCKGRGGSALPYRLLDLLASPQGTPVYICEGPGDADRADAAGVLAIHLPSGTERDPVVRVWLRGRPVVLVRDKDDGGTRRIRCLIKALTGVVRSIRVVEPAVDGTGADLSDHLDAGRPIAELVERDPADFIEPPAPPHPQLHTSGPETRGGAYRRRCYGEAALVQERCRLAATSQGNQNNILFEVAFRLSQLADAGCLS